jgi:hypothetical protein
MRRTPSGDAATAASRRRLGVCEFSCMTTYELSAIEHLSQFGVFPAVENGKSSHGFTASIAYSS